MTVTASIRGVEVAEIALEYGSQFASSTGEGAHWMIDVSAVMKMLRAAERGEIAVGDAANVIMAAVGEFSKRSGCCPECDEAADHYATVLSEYDEALARHNAEVAAMTPESHPFVISGSSGKVHAWNCSTRPHQLEIVHPGRTLHEYVHGGQWDGSGYMQPRTRGGSVRVSADDLVQRFRGRKVNRCKVCAPLLPAFMSEASDVPATGRG